MKFNIRKQVFLLAALCGLLCGPLVSARSFIRYIKPEDIGTKTLYADSVLTSITLPRGVARLANYPQFNAAVYELSRVLQDPSKELMQVWVCGSTCPDGLWAENVALSQARTDAAATYLSDVTGIPESKIHKESLNEDWDRLAELVTESDIPYKYEILYIIRTKNWGERKTALQKLDGGKVWKTLQKDFFPKLRCVRFAIYCKWDPTKPYLSAPVEEPAVKEVIKEIVKETVYVKDTVYVRDTVYILRQAAPVVVVKDTVVVSAPVAEPTPVVAPSVPVTREEAYQQYRNTSLKAKEKKYWDTPWMVGLKTNLIADAMAVPMAGLEFQIGNHVSLDLEGWYTTYNMFCKEDTNTNFYGFTPEVRWWVKGRAMERGSFFGIHARAAWYTLQWTDGFLYQNGEKDTYQDMAGNDFPAWSVGLTYGYAFALDRKAHWGVEILLGMGYGTYSHNRGLWNEAENKWTIHDHQNNTHIGITRAGINLTYRFSVRRVKPEYYER